jgi:hypothetical protein
MGPEIKRKKQNIMFTHKISQTSTWSSSARGGRARHETACAKNIMRTAISSLDIKSSTIACNDTHIPKTNYDPQNLQQMERYRVGKNDQSMKGVVNHGNGISGPSLIFLRRGIVIGVKNVPLFYSSSFFMGKSPNTAHRYFSSFT